MKPTNQTEIEMTDKEDKILTAAFIVAVILALGSVIFAMHRMLRTEEFNKREHNGHTYVFYGDRPVEHDVECRKCLERFD